MRKHTNKSLKWTRPLLSFVVILTSLILILVAAMQVWLSTWKTYENDEFGFSFRHPANWFVTESNPITKVQVDTYNQTGLYVDSVKDLPNHPFSGPIRSPGDVEVDIENNESILKSRQQQGYKLATQAFGTKIGYVDESIGQTTQDLGSRSVFEKESFVSTDNYFFFANTTTLSDNSNFLSELKARFYHWMGSRIIDSFIFTK